MMHSGTSFPTLAVSYFLSVSSAVSGAGKNGIAPLPGALPDRTYSGPNWLVLAGDKILVWNYDGKARVRAANGHWQPEFHLPVRDILTVVADSKGFLVSGALPRPIAAYAIALFDPIGRELRRWNLSRPIFYLSITDKGRYAATENGLFPLLEDGRLGPFQHYPIGLSVGLMGGAQLIEGENRVLCRGSDVSLAHRAFARCEELRPMGWSIARDAAIQPPAVCGPWIIFREGDRLERLTVHSSRTGAMMGSRTFGPMPAITCADSQTLAIGGKSLEWARLPSLRPMWKKRLRRGRIRDLMVLGDSIAFILADSPTLYLLARNRNSNPPSTSKEQ